MEFYGIDGENVTLAQAAKRNLLVDQKKWAEALWLCSQAVAYLHRHFYLHCDIKGDNIVFNEMNGQFFPIIIDFGKMRKISESKKYKLSSKQKYKYRTYHKHIAPEVVWGTHPPSPASDVYAFGLLISLICHFNTYDDLRKIAVKCIHGTPEKRPNMDAIISDLYIISL